MIRAESDPYERAVVAGKAHVLAVLSTVALGPGTEMDGLSNTLEDLREARDKVPTGQKANIMPEALRRLGWDHLFDVAN